MTLHRFVMETKNATRFIFPGCTPESLNITNEIPCFVNENARFDGSRRDKNIEFCTIQVNDAHHQTLVNEMKPSFYRRLNSVRNQALLQLSSNPTTKELKVPDKVLMTISGIYHCLYLSLLYENLESLTISQHFGSKYQII